MKASIAFVLQHWALIAITLLLAVVGAQELRVGRAQAETANARATLAGERVAAALASTTAQKKARDEETRRETEKQEVIRHAQEQTAVAKAAARDAGLAAAGLRQQVAALVANSRRAAADPSPATGGPPAADALDLLADVLQHVDDRSGELAAEADRRGIAGATCERAYDALTASPASPASK